MVFTIEVQKIASFVGKAVLLPYDLEVRKCILPRGQCDALTQLKDGHAKFLNKTGVMYHLWVILSDLEVSAVIYRR